MKPSIKSFSYMFFDILCIGLSFLAAALLRFDLVPSDAFEFLGRMSPLYYIVGAAATLVSGLLLGTYRELYVTIYLRDIVRQVEIGFIAVAAIYLSHHVLDFSVSMSITFMYGFFFLVFSLGARYARRFLRFLLNSRGKTDNPFRRVVIVGAGMAGSTLVHMLATKRDMGIVPVAVVDDDPTKQQMMLSGIRVRGAISDIDKVAKDSRADEIIVAIPSASSAQLKEIFESCRGTGLPVKTFGSFLDFQQFMSGSKTALRNLSIEDLLFRNSIKTDMGKVKSYIEGKTVLVTGGAGSIGSEICRQVLKYGCKYLVVMDINENGLFFLQNDLLATYPKERFCVRVGSVRDKVRMGYLFRRHKFDIVFHAAAHKHVPLMEDNVFEAVKNNIFGTKNTIECCIENGTERFVLISTDKAVNPTNIMGATKRVAELLVQRYNGRGCELSAVRFGNVLGSNGSVIPIFKRQIEEGGPVTVTHRDIMRYFMTIPEAVSLVLNAGVAAKGGEIFVLDMGEPVSIYDLAHNMIELAGYTVGKDIEIKITGLRPGEKMFEELKLDSESHSRTAHDKIFVMHANEPTDKVDADIAKLEELVLEDSGEPTLREAVFETISIDFEESTRHGADLAEFSSLK